MDDLVKRLRDSFTYDQQHYAPDPLVAEAADRIEELERKVERLTYDGIHTCSDQCERLVCVLRRQIEELESWKAAEEAHHHMLRAEIARLREADYKSFTDGLEAAAQICGSLAELEYDDADSFEAATGCEAAIMRVVKQQRGEQGRTALKEINND